MESIHKRKEVLRIVEDGERKNAGWVKI